MPQNWISSTQQAICGRVGEVSLAGFTEEERQQFAEYLRRMYRNLTGREIDAGV